ncbi:hypothetical protein [Aestuariivita sp.]|jgi:hypothetical protein|uniref:hypothetical protein n=1 Tax=Aestuariivita sp. TaxID=1872407 RepID=UPI002171EA21|nr:hypothetical protein [Aestuariivita sp.]MCE8005869.1 hypothetical protein [Aestuariivita sp.]
MRWILIVWVVWAGPVSAQGYSTPERGTALRAALMDAIRPHAEWMLGTPVQFVVRDLRVAGDVGFASLSPQRPGGAEINLVQTPGYARGALHAGADGNGAAMQVLYKRAGQTWVAVHWVIGATDVWWSYPPLCAEYRAVTPEVC